LDDTGDGPALDGFDLDQEFLDAGKIVRVAIAEDAELRTYLDQLVQDVAELGRLVRRGDDLERLDADLAGRLRAVEGILEAAAVPPARNSVATYR